MKKLNLMNTFYSLRTHATIVGTLVGWLLIAWPSAATLRPLLADYTADIACATPALVALSCDEIAQSGTIELDQRLFHKARGRVGEKVSVGTVHVKAVGLPESVTLQPSAAVEGIYTTDVTTLPAGTSETDVTVYYEARKVGKDEGRIYFMAGDEIYEEISIKGLATDPANPPTVRLEPTVFQAFSTEVGQPVRDTLTAHISGLPSSVMVSLKQEQPGFTCNTSMLYYSVKEHQLVVTFNPKSAGTYEATLTLTNEFIEPLVVTLQGTATTEESVEPEVEGDVLQLTYDNPLPLLHEGFDGVAHNKPLSVDRWQNVATIGNRAWWGYTFPDYDEENGGETVAKVTPYDSKVEYGEDSECQMLLITPPLDYKQAASKMFTFRVMGKNMIKGSSDVFMCCNLVVDDGQLWALPIEGVEMPSSPDQNGEWIDYHVDLSYLDLGEVFHIGFLYYGMRGTVSSAQYYIDDVSFGRTDLPLITPVQREVTMQVASAADRMSAPVAVEADNLTEPIKLKLGGSHGDAFELSTTTLPKEGGAFTVKFKSELEGTYMAHVKLTSRGAATQYVSFVATVATGIQTLTTAEYDAVEVVDSSGRTLLRTQGVAVHEALQQLPAGTYIVRVSNSQGTRIQKLVK